MEAWQIVVAGLLVVAPLVLLVAFHPGRERVDARGRPLPRAWPTRRTSGPASPEEADHH